MVEIDPRITKLAQQLGVSFDARVVGQDVPQYRGSDRSLGTLCRGLYYGPPGRTRGRREASRAGAVHPVNSLFLLHDLAHFIIATPFQRDLDNFGLGASIHEPDFASRWWSDNNKRTHKNIISREESRAQEAAAFMLGQHWYLTLMDWHSRPIIPSYSLNPWNVIARIETALAITPASLDNK